MGSPISATHSSVMWWPRSPSYLVANDSERVGVDEHFPYACKRQLAKVLSGDAMAVWRRKQAR